MPKTNMHGEQTCTGRPLQETDHCRLIDFFPEGIIIHRHWKIVYVNPSGVNMLGGRAAQDLLGQSLLTMVHPHDREKAQRRTRHVEKRGIAAEPQEMRLLKNSRQTIHVEASAIQVNYRGRPSVLSVMRDITERKRTEELLRKSEKLSVVGELAAGLAHEIRNPLTSMKGFLQLAREGDVNGKYREGDYNAKYMDIFFSELERIESIVNELLILAKPQVVKEEYVQIDQVLTQVLTMISPLRNAHNVRLEQQVSPDLPVIKCEANRLKQVFINILKNGIEAMADGGELTVRAFQSEAGQIRIQFVDQGCGIPKDKLSKLGEPFYTTKKEGMGLGLMITYRIVEELGGRIVIQSEVNKGTQVEVVLPCL